MSSHLSGHLFSSPKISEKGISKWQPRFYEDAHPIFHTCVSRPLLVLEWTMLHDVFFCYYSLWASCKFTILRHLKLLPNIHQTWTHLAKAAYYWDSLHIKVRICLSRCWYRAPKWTFLNPRLTFSNTRGLDIVRKNWAKESRKVLAKETVCVEIIFLYGKNQNESCVKTVHIKLSYSALSDNFSWFDLKEATINVDFWEACLRERDLCSNPTLVEGFPLTNAQCMNFVPFVA